MYIKNIPGKGRGVYASKTIKKGVLIEACELLVIPKKELPFIKKTVLDEYYFEWSGGRAAIPLGYGALYNHSFSPCADFFYDEKNAKIRFVAIRPIKKGEEIVVNYNGDPKDQSKSLVWFPVIDQGVKKKK